MFKNYEGGGLFWSIKIIEKEPILSTIVSTTFLYHNFDNIRSYASKGVADIRSVPPRNAKLNIPIAIQCKNTKNPGYLEPKERNSLGKFSKKYSYIVIMMYKDGRDCKIKLQPWHLNGKVMEPHVFLKTYYGIEADTWKVWRKNWFKEKIIRSKNK